MNLFHAAYGIKLLVISTVKQLWNHAMHVLHKFYGFNINTTAFCLDQYSLHLPLLKSSMAYLLVLVSRDCRESSFRKCERQDAVKVVHVQRGRLQRV